MVTQLRDPHIVAGNAINNPVFACDPARPIPLQRVLQRLRFPDSPIGIAHDLLDELVNAPERLRIRFLPIEILPPGIIREDEIHTSSFNFLRTPFPRSS